MTTPTPLYIKSDLPPGRSGEWRLEKYVVKDVEPGRDTRPDPFKTRGGTFTRLWHGTTVFMTDLYNEWWTQRRGMLEALERGGNVLITGLGIGMVVESILRPDDSPVDSVTVVEFSPDVIALVKPHLLRRYGDRLRIVEADAFTWEPDPELRFSVGWHDIWPNPDEDRNYPEIEELFRRYRSVCDWQGAWPLEFVTAAEIDRPEAARAAAILDQ